MMAIRERVLKLLLHKCPQGDLASCGNESQYKISCIFIFYKRYEMMENILFCLLSQDLPKNLFEIILVEDRGGSEHGRSFTKQFSGMNISYFAPPEGWGKMGFMRNFGLSKSKGEIILFLDDDTVISDGNFLSDLSRQMTNRHCDAVIPHGNASWSLIKGRYAFHDPYFFSNRCMAYKKTCLSLLKGFDSNFTGQEDVELAIRFIFHGFNAEKSKTLNYYHPPLIYFDQSKGYAVGSSFADSKYPIYFKIMLLLNGSRWIYRIFLPGPKNSYMATFAFGFLKGFLMKLIRKKDNAEYK